MMKKLLREIGHFSHLLSLVAFVMVVVVTVIPGGNATAEIVTGLFGIFVGIAHVWRIRYTENYPVSQPLSIFNRYSGLVWLATGSLFIVSAIWGH